MEMLQASALSGHESSKGHQLCLKRAESPELEAPAGQPLWDSTTPSLDHFMLAATVVGRHDSFEDVWF